MLGSSTMINPDFYPRSPCGERLLMWYQCNTVVKISIHALLAESDTCTRRPISRVLHFYPRSPCGERPADIASFAGLCNFYPRSPCGERHPAPVPCRPHADISIHALLAESDGIPNQVGTWEVISIHALLAESDCTIIDPEIKIATISIHALLAESDWSGSWSALPGWYFYPRSPCGERRAGFGHVAGRQEISIHALLAESDTAFQKLMAALLQFLSTLSLRRATCTPRSAGPWQGISIHALLAESDNLLRFKTVKFKLFLSTLSLRRATLLFLIFPLFLLFLSTLSLRRATRLFFIVFDLFRFLSTLSLRRATAKVHKTVGHFCAYETNFMEIASSC